MDLDPEYRILADISDSAQRLLESRSRINSVFKELAIRDTIMIDDTLAVMLDTKIREVKISRPDLSDVEAYAVAGKLLKQLILVYKSALDALLP